MNIILLNWVRTDEARPVFFEICQIFFAFASRAETHGCGLVSPIPAVINAPTEKGLSIKTLESGRSPSPGVRPKAKSDGYPLGLRRTFFVLGGVAVVVPGPIAGVGVRILCPTFLRGSVAFGVYSLGARGKSTVITGGSDRPLAHLSNFVSVLA